jgi:hypothetical protein
LQSNPGNGRRLLEDGETAELAVNPALINYANTQNISTSLAWQGTISRSTVVDGCR